MLPKQNKLPDWTNFPVRIGCPVWRSVGWVGSVYTKAAEQNQAVAVYSETFPTVEGNSTFYSLPSIELARKWAADSAEGFRFCFKVPRLISHELELRNARVELDDFLARMEPLLAAKKLGPIFLQLSPTFDGARWQLLDEFLAILPPAFPWAVELRHSDWFGESPYCKRLEERLRERNIDRVLFDATYLHSHPARTEAERISRGRKPNSPQTIVVTGTSPMVRLIGHDLVEDADELNILRHWQPWIECIGRWVAEGLRPYVFVHTPDDAFAPKLCSAFYDALRRELDSVHNIALPTLPAMPLRAKPKVQSTFDFGD